jgi:glutaryl-CoA dehydrogenase
VAAEGVEREEVMPLESLDLYEVEQLYREEERIVRDTVRAWVRERVLPHIEAWAWEGRFPLELVPEMAGLALFGPTFTEYGLPGLSNVGYGLVMQELERGDSGLRSFVSVQSALVMYPIMTWGSDEQKDRWIPLLAAGKAIGCFGLTEPDFGSNPGAMRTRARREGDGWVISGEKAWITNGSIADVAVVWAKDEGGVVRGFLVEKGTPGFSAVEHKGKYSLRASVTSQLVLAECRVPETGRLPGAAGLACPLSCLTQARYGIAWGALGSALATFHAALEYSKSRTQFGGAPIASHQIVQEKLVWMANEITKGQLMVWRLGRLKDEGEATFVQVSQAKRNSCWVARECARLAREIHGANGIVNEFPVMRHLMNIESVYTYEGTHDMHTLILGEHLTGIPAFMPPRSA